MTENYIADVDSYKICHHLAYPPDTKYLMSYVEARAGDISKETVFFGLQMILMKTLKNKVTQEMVEEMREIAELHGFADTFNYKGWCDIVTKLKGRLPLKIKAVKEGSIVPYSNVLMTIENTHPDFPWLVSWMETQLLRVWYPISVATISYSIKKVIRKYLEETSDNPEAELPFKLHDFGSRGVSSRESAEIGGLAHLVNFKGSDTIVALMAAKKYYGEPMAGFSIPASEHSTVTTWTKEVDAYRNMIEKFGHKGKIFACVSDSYDLTNAVENIWGDELKMQVISCGGTLVVRPDSGDPVEVVLETVKALDKRFGSKINEKGYLVLHECVRVIQGDGVDEQSITAILAALKKEGYSASNIAFGMGGALLQKVNRDSFAFAMKTCWGKFGTEERDICKKPKHDKAKASKKGRLTLRKINGKYITVDGREANLAGEEALHLVYFDGEIVSATSFFEVRKLANERV